MADLVAQFCLTSGVWVDGKVLQQPPAHASNLTGTRAPPVWDFSGEFGLTSLDDGYYYVADDGEIEEHGVQKETGTAELHRWTGETATPFEKVETPQ